MINTEMSELSQQSYKNRETFCDATASAQTAQVCRDVLRSQDDSAHDDSREDAWGPTIGFW